MLFLCLCAFLWWQFYLSLFHISEACGYMQIAGAVSLPVYLHADGFTAGFTYASQQPPLCEEFASLYWYLRDLCIRK